MAFDPFHLGRPQRHPSTSRSTKSRGTTRRSSSSGNKQRTTRRRQTSDRTHPYGYPDRHSYEGPGMRPRNAAAQYVRDLDQYFDEVAQQRYENANYGRAPYPKQVRPERSAARRYTDPVMPTYREPQDHPFNGLNFNQAFAKARNMGLDKFVWRNRVYTTQIAGQPRQRMAAPAPQVLAPPTLPDEPIVERGLPPIPEPELRIPEEYHGVLAALEQIPGLIQHGYGGYLFPVII